MRRVQKRFEYRGEGGRERGRRPVAGLFLAAGLLAAIGCGHSTSTPEKTEAERTRAAQETEVSLLCEISLKSETEKMAAKEAVLETRRAQIREEEAVLNKVNSLTLEQKVAQMFVLAPEDFLDLGQVTAAGEQTRARLRQYPIGGYVYFESNIVNPEQLRAMNENLQRCSMDMVGLPFFTAVDEEGGTVLRIADNPAFGEQAEGNMCDVGASGDASAAYQVGTHIGGYLRKYGINVDFAPVADVYSNSANTVVRYRSFGSDPALVSEMVAGELRGLQEQGILAAVKHFPGHGATDADTHAGFAVVEKTLEELWDNEFLPFFRAVQEDVPFIMVGHLSLPQVTGDDVPATLSHTLITEILRGQLGFQGIVITDAMKMEAITDRYDAASAAVLAVQAGVDVILMPADFEAAYQGILSAVHSGEISEARIDESVSRIVRAKLWLLERE